MVKQIKMKSTGPPRRAITVLEGRDWHCNYCPKGYLSKNALVHHERKAHKFELVEERRVIQTS